MSNNNKHNQNSSQKLQIYQHSTIDRSIHPTFPHTHTSSLPPSSHPSSTPIPIPPQQERLYRLHGTSLLNHATVLLRLYSSSTPINHQPPPPSSSDTNHPPLTSSSSAQSDSVYATSTTLFHRFYHRQPFTKYNVWSVSMACTLLACKIEEVPGRGPGRSLSRDIVLVYVHLYRRFRLGFLATNRGSNTRSLLQTARSNLVANTNNPMSLEELRNVLRYIRPMPENEEFYKMWEKEMFDTENVVLRELGFSLYWIPEGHPHVFLLYFLKVLEVEDGGGGGNANGGNDSRENGTASNGSGGDTNLLSVGQIAWNYCNDSCRLDFCVRYPPEVTACAAIYLACHRNDIPLPLSPRPWWQVFLGVDCDQDLSNVCNALLALCCEVEEGGEEGSDDDGFVEEYQTVLRTFLVSLVPGSLGGGDVGGGDGEGGGSFNDPGFKGDGKMGFVWNFVD